jgi:hypothetical protein|tara:strand:- start:3199 stop:5139 length:1941 start_codon:yes stop_codon:yes gene_type:complete
MRTGAITSPVITSGDMPSSVMGMDANGMDMATYFMRDKIYSDKILANVREYLSNGVDEHRKHNIDRPVEFGVSSKDDQVDQFWVRDFAHGLSDENIRNTFGMYFRSTKSDSDAEIGGFGVGSKAGHCYSDTFFVDSFFEGKKTSYSCVLGGSKTGVPVGQIFEMHSEPTKESGLLVSLDIKKRDSSSFIDRCKQLAFTFKDEVVFRELDTVFQPEKSIETVESDGFLFSSYESPHCINLFSNQISRLSSDKLKLIISMGGIPYNYEQSVTDLSPMKNLVHVDVPVGSLTLPINRESIEKTTANDRVIDKIMKAYVKVQEQDKLDNIKKHTLAKFFYDRYCGNIGSQSNMNTPWGIYFWFELLTDESYVVQNFKFVTMPHRLLHKTKGKTTVVLRPDNAAFKRWNAKIVKYAKLNGSNIVYMSEDKWALVADSVKLNLSKVFTFVSARKLKFKKNGKTDTSVGYCLYNKNKGRIGSFTPLEYAQKTIGEYTGDKPCGESAVKKFLKDFNPSTRQEFLVFSMGLIDHSYHYGVSPPIRVRSIKMYDGLRKLGFLDGSDWPKFKDKIVKKEEEEKAINSTFYGIKHGPVMFKANLIDRLSKNLSRAQQFTKIINSITAEDTVRGRIYRSLSDYQKITREDLRAILTLDK